MGDRTDVYVRFTDQPVTRTRTIGWGDDREVNLDIDSNDHFVGVEILDAHSVEINGKRVPSAPAGAGAVTPVATDEVYAWHQNRFGVPDVAMVALKLSEEVGEVAEAIVKRAEGAIRPAKGLTTREEWTAHLLGEIGDVGIVLHVLCAREGVNLADVIAARFRGDVSLRDPQEAGRG